MSIKVYDYRCEKCGHELERFEESGTEIIVAGCARQCNTMCTLKRVPSTGHFPQHSDPNFMSKHRARARALGFDNSNEAKIGRYDDDDPKTYKKKIQVVKG